MTQSGLGTKIPVSSISKLTANKSIALARNSDPETSHIAAATVEASGAAQNQRDLALSAVQESPGRTATELEAYYGLDRYMLSRRLPELRDEGAVQQCAICSMGRLTCRICEKRHDVKRVCEIKGRPMQVWWPSDTLF